MITTYNSRAIPVIGVALGLGVALAAVLSWRIPASSQSLGAELRFVPAATGEVSISPDGPLLTARGLAPGDSAGRRFRLENVAGRPLRVRLRALPSQRALDRALQVELTAAGRRIYAGRLGELRSFASGGALNLPRKGSVEVEMRARLDRGAGPDHEGQIVDVTMELQARAAGGPR